MHIYHYSTNVGKEYTSDGMITTGKKIVTGDQYVQLLDALAKKLDVDRKVVHVEIVSLSYHGASDD